MVKSFFITIFALLFSTCLFGQTPEDMIKNDWPNTFASFGKNSKNVPSHFIFVIDISDKNFGKDIVNQIGIFADALPKNDKITVIQLGPTDETKELVVTTDINEALLKEIKLKEDAIRNAELAKQSKQFIRTIDSLKSLTTDYVELHHPFDQVYIIKKDLNDYYKLIERVKSMKGKKIVIVSAADCNGALEYNEDLSLRRAKRIFKSLANSYNNTIIKQVGERELLKDCGEARKDIEEQVVNRYSYIFILNK